MSSNPISSDERTPVTLTARFVMAFERLLSLWFGSSHYQQWQQRFFLNRLQLVLKVATIAYLSFIIIQLITMIQGNSTLLPDWFTMAVLVEVILITCLGITFTSYGRRYLAALFLCSACSVTVIEQVWATWHGFALTGLFSWTLVFLTLAVFVPVRWQLHVVAQAVTLGYYAISTLVLRLPPINESLDATYILYLFWFCAICSFGVYKYESLQQAEFEARQWLRKEQEKSERLLLNILPAAIANQLKTQDETSIAEQYANVSVLFADIVGFTALTASMSPVETVKLLNHLFSAFDQLAEEYGLEKIKTIGDAYMVVGGLPIERNDHAEAIANMALAMRTSLISINSSHQYNLSMRIGIHTGPVIAGVIGKKKFIYDLWGDTVNTASRMESQGVPNQIQVTEETYLCLKNNYHLQERGVIPIKGKGNMTTYFLMGTAH